MSRGTTVDVFSASLSLLIISPVSFSGTISDMIFSGLETAVSGIFSDSISSIFCLTISKPSLFSEGRSTSFLT